MIPATSVRVPKHTSPNINQGIREQTEKDITCYLSADAERIDRRLKELDDEWDIERTLEMNASALASVGVVLGLLSSRRWLLLPLAVTGFLMLHAVQGWCPPVALFRRLGIRTSREIDNERQALKMLRNDYQNMPERTQADSSQAEQLLRIAEK